MKKVVTLFGFLFLLTGCAESLALLGPVSSVAQGGNVVQSTLSSAASYGIKKSTGKSPMEHATGYAEKANPEKKKEKCINFLEATNSEACAIAKKRINELKVMIKQKSNIKNFDQ